MCAVGRNSPGVACCSKQAIKEPPHPTPWGGSCYFQLSDLSRPPREGVIANLASTLPSSSDCNAWLWLEV